MLHLTIPTKNEAPYITDTIRRISKSLSDLQIPWQIIIADNGSTDNTRLAANEQRTTNNELREKISVLDCPKVGKGAAIRFASNQVTATLFSKEGHPAKCGVGRFPTSESQFPVPNSQFPELFGFIDADLSADPDAIPGMVNRILEDKADVVIASRLLITKTTNRSWLRTISSQAFNFFADLILKLDVEDAQCGLKIMNQKGLEILKSCKEDGWFLDIEFLTRARQNKLRIVEVPVPWLEFRYPHRKSHIRHLRDGLEAIRAIFRIKYNAK